MTSLTICSGIAALLYLAAGMAIVGAMKQKAGKASSLIRWPVLLGLILHGYAVEGEMFRPDAVHFGFAFALSVTFFFAVIALFIETIIHRLHGQFGIILIAAAFGTILPVIFPGNPIPAQEWTVLFRWHLPRLGRIQLHDDRARAGRADGPAEPSAQAAATTSENNFLDSLPASS